MDIDNFGSDTNYRELNKHLDSVKLDTGSMKACFEELYNINRNLQNTQIKEVLETLQFYVYKSADHIVKLDKTIDVIATTGSIMNDSFKGVEDQYKQIIENENTKSYGIGPIRDYRDALYFISQYQPGIDN